VCWFVTRYWFSDDDAQTERAVEVLHAVRRFHAADLAMRQRLKTDMEMGETDLRALRHLISAETRGTVISPKDLAEKLSISSAAIAKLLARLVESGHIRREANPRDHRAQILYATPAAHSEVRKTLSDMHERMMAVAEGLSAAEQRAVIRCLDLLSDAVSAP
jgi:DNA-binding MarR family transcriptional regulator